ncbi:MAG: M50 family metallopeptidase [Terriglobales bacterium]
MPETQDTTANSSTPIFDSGVLPPRTSQITLQSLLLGFLIGTVPFLSAVILIMAGRQGNDSLDVSLLSACLVLVVATFVHEAGHLLAGWAVGFRFSRIQLGPLSLSIAQGRLRVRLREMTALGYAGMHVNRLRRLRRRMLIFLAAGPATNLLSLLVMVLLLYFFPQLINAWVAIPAAQFAVVSCLLGMLSLWPFPSTGSSDGARIMMLLRSRDRARRWLNILALIHAHDQGTPVKLCKNSWLRAASSLNDASRDNFRGNWLAYISANGRDNAPIAALHLEKCLELARLLPRSTRDVLALESTVFAAWFRNDALLADKWFAQLQKPNRVTRLAKIRVGIATSCARRDFHNAKKEWQDGLAYIDRAKKVNSQKLLKESWLGWRAEILEREVRPPVMDGRYTVHSCSTET